MDIATTKPRIVSSIWVLLILLAVIFTFKGPTPFEINIRPTKVERPETKTPTPPPPTIPPVRGGGDDLCDRLRSEYNYLLNQTVANIQIYLVDMASLDRISHHPFRRGDYLAKDFRTLRDVKIKKWVKQLTEAYNKWARRCGFPPTTEDEIYKELLYLI
jgi:hypothetical protein